MPWTGAGGFVELGPPDFPAVTGQVITAEYFNNVIRDLVEGLNTALAQNGEAAGTGTQVFANLTVTGTLSVIAIPRRTSGWANGQALAVSAGQTLNTSDMAAGYAFTLVNISDVAITLTQGSGVTLRLAGTLDSGDLELAARGICTIWCNSGSDAYAAGAGLSLA